LKPFFKNRNWTHNNTLPGRLNRIAPTIKNSATMSFGGGIARFASRKIDTDKENDLATATLQDDRKDQPAAISANGGFSFATNDAHDTLSTASDDEFGFLGGSNSIGGSEFCFMGDGDFDDEKDDTETFGVDSTLTTEVSDRNIAAIFLFDQNDNLSSMFFSFS
jgi:hypothetical protein